MIGAIIITFILLIIAIAFFIPKELKTYLKINFVDFKENNFYDKISLSFENDKKPEIFGISKNNAVFYVTKFANKKIINIKISIINSSLKNSKSFKIKIYTNSKNIINVKINNKSQIYYNSEIIFYCQYLTTNNINIDNLEFCSHNLKYRKRLLICNFDEADFIKIINNNINNIDLQNKALNVIKSNYNQLLLINIYTGRNTSNILIFKEKENKKPLIIPIKEEKNFFKNFYLEIYNNKDNIDNLIEICGDYKEKLVNKKKYLILIYQI